MADHTININVDGGDDSRGDNPGTGDARSYPIGVSQEELDKFVELLGHDAISTEDVDALSQMIDEFREAVFNKEGGDAEPEALSEMIQEFREAVFGPETSLTSLQESAGEAAQSVDDLRNSLTEASEVSEEYEKQRQQFLNDLIDSFDELDELEETQEDMVASYANLFRQLTNMGRAAGVVSVRSNQMAQAFAVMSKGFTGTALILGTTVAAIAATVIAIKGLNSAAESLAKEIGGFSSEVAKATAERRRQEVEDKIRAGDEIGEDAASFIEGSNELSVEVREFKREIMKLLLPFLGFLTRILGAVLAGLNNILKVLNLILIPIQAILESMNFIFDWWRGEEGAEEAQKDFMGIFQLPDTDLKKKGETRDLQRRFNKQRRTFLDGPPGVGD